MSGPYSIIYMDAPLRFEVRDRKTGLGKSPDAHYDTMTDEDFLALPVPDWAAKHAHLVAWMYDPKIPVMMKAAEQWGFRYCTVLFRWLKTTYDNRDQIPLFVAPETLNFGTGYHTRGGGCEECWLFKKGDGLPVLRHDIRKEFYSPIREHSRKPDEVPGWLVDLYGDHPRLEMFARTQRPGWDVFGDETTKFQAAE